MPIDPVLPHDLDDLYGAGAEDAESFVIAQQELLDKVNEHLGSLPNDEDRLSFLHGLEVCLLCGSKILPCYCAPQYDE